MAVPQFGRYLPAPTPVGAPVLGGIQAATGVLGQLSGIETQKARTEIARAQEERLRQQAEAEAGMTPLRRQLLEAQIAKMRQPLEHPELTLAGLPSITRQRAYVAAVKDKYGADSEQAKQAQEDLDFNIHKEESALHYRETLTEALPRRFLTAPSKAMMEREAIKAGRAPTGLPYQLPGVAPTVAPTEIPPTPETAVEPITQPINPKVPGTPMGLPSMENKLSKMSKEDLVKAQDSPFGSEDSARLTLYLSKQAGMGDNTKKLNYGAGLERTMELMDPYKASMAYYAGVGGKAQLAKDIATSQATGKLTPQLKDFTSFMELATSTLVPQITQYYGLSITEHQQNLLREATSPNSWENSPERAMVAWDTLTNTLENEIQVRKDLVEHPSFLTKRHAKATPLYESVKKTGYSLNELVRAADAQNIPVTDLITEINRLKG
jgi:hypothetical protein